MNSQQYYLNLFLVLGSRHNNTTKLDHKSFRYTRKQYIIYVLAKEDERAITS